MIPMMQNTQDRRDLRLAAIPSWYEFVDLQTNPRVSADSEGCPRLVR